MHESEPSRATIRLHTTPEKFENARISVHFGFMFEENSVREITGLLRFHKAGVFKLLRFKKRFQKSHVFVTDKCVDRRLN